MPWSHTGTAWESRSALHPALPDSGTEGWEPDWKTKPGKGTSHSYKGGRGQLLSCLGRPWPGASQDRDPCPELWLQQDSPSQRWGGAPALCPKARGRTGGQKGQEAVSCLIGTISPPPTSLV